MSNKQRPCPSCRAIGRDKTGNHLFVMSSGDAWYCARCGYKESLDGRILAYGHLEPQENDLEWGEVNRCVRGISPQTRQVYSCQAQYDVTNGEIVALRYRYPNGYKIRHLPKRFQWFGDRRYFFYGQDVFPRPKTIIICGGEEDAMAAFEILRRFPSPPACVSFPHGEQSIHAITQQKEWLAKAEKIYLCLDNDEAGREATEKALKLLDYQALVVELPEDCKDVNECLTKGKEEEFIHALRKATKRRPGGLLTVDDVAEKALEKPKWGIAFPWPTLTKATYGIRPGEGYYWGAGVKCGKTTALNELACWLVEQQQRVLLIKAEEVPHITVRRMAGRMIGRIAHRPDIDVPDEQIKQAIAQMRDYVWLYDRHNMLNWEDVKSVIKHCVVVEGVKHVFLDPVTCFTDGMDASDANTFLQKFAREIDQMAKDLDFTYHVYCHLKAPTSGPPHEFGGKVMSAQFAGSRAMMRTTTYMVGIERNKSPELPEKERNTSYFVLLEDRNNGNIVRFPVYYNPDTGSYREPDPSEGEF